MIKVALLIPTLDRSGAEKQLALLARGLPQDEFDVRVMALTRGGPFEQDLTEAGIPVRVIGKRFKCDPLSAWKLRRVLKEFQPDILHTWLFAAHTYGRLVAGRSHRPKIVVSERCVDEWKSGWQFQVDRWLADRTDLFVGNSPSVSEFYEQKEIGVGRWRTIPNAIEPNGTSADDLAKDRAALLQELNLPHDAQLVGTVGRLAPQKRVRDLVWATELARQLNPNIYGLIIGDGPERDSLMQFAREIGVADHLRFLGHRSDVRQILPLLDVFLLASSFEGMSNSIMEAMDAGVPVIASDIPPNRELVIDGETGYLVKVADSVGFAQFADRLLADHSLADRMGTASRERIDRMFRPAGMISAYAELYRDLIRAETTPIQQNG